MEEERDYEKEENSSNCKKDLDFSTGQAKLPEKPTERVEKPEYLERG